MKEVNVYPDKLSVFIYWCGDVFLNDFVKNFRSENSENF